MTTYLGKSCSFCLPRVPFVNCCQFMYLVISLLVLRAGYGIWLYQFLIIAYLFTLFDDRIATTLLGKSCFLVVPGAYVCPWVLIGLFDDRMVTTLLGKSCFLAVLGSYVCLWGLTCFFDDRVVVTLLGKSYFLAILGAHFCPWGLTA